MAAKEEEALDASLEELRQLVESGNASWREMAPLARRALARIGIGIIQTSPAQVAALKEIVTRAEGRAGQLREEGTKNAPLGIVILPTKVDAQGKRAVMDYEV